MAAYAELQVTSNYSFLRGASHIEELFAQASLLGLKTLGITDRNSLAGIVRAHQRATDTGVRLVVGCRLDLTDFSPVLVYPTDRPAYARLCRLLTIGKRRAGKGACTLTWADLAAHADGLIAILLADAPDATTQANLTRLRADFPGRAYLALTLHRRPNDAVRLQQLADLATGERIPTVVTGDVLYHAPQRRILQDVLTCIRHGCTIDDAGFRRSVLPTATSNRLTKYSACSRVTPTPSPAPSKLPTAAAFRSTNCVTNTPPRSGFPARPRSRRWRPSPGTAPPAPTPTASPPASHNSSVTN